MNFIKATAQFAASPVTDSFQLAKNLFRPNSQTQTVIAWADPKQRATAINDIFSGVVDEITGESKKSKLEAKITLSSRNELPGYYWSTITWLIEQVVRAVFFWMLPAHNENKQTLDLPQDLLQQTLDGTLKGGATVKIGDRDYTLARSFAGTVKKLYEDLEKTIEAHRNCYDVKRPDGTRLLGNILLSPSHQTFTFDEDDNAFLSMERDENWYVKQGEYLNTSVLKGKVDDAKNTLTIDLPAGWDFDSTSSLTYILDNGVLFVKTTMQADESTEEHHFFLINDRIKVGETLTVDGGSLVLSLSPLPTTEPK